jgi:hypothetical protein
MGYYRTNELQCKKVTPAEALKFLEINTFHGQRKLNHGKASAYAKIMAAGKMRPVDIDVALCPGGVRYLMNGQHVCTAITIYGKPFDARVQHWKCDTMEDAWHLFGTFDVHVTRTESHIVKAARPFLVGLEDVPLRILATCSTALFLLAGGRPNFNARYVPTVKTEKCDLLLPNINEVLFVDKMLEKCGSDRQSIIKLPSVVAMIETMRKSEEKAYDFWSNVCSGEMLLKDMPEFRLANVLMEKKMNGGSGIKELYIYCICYWNSWIKNEPRKQVKLSQRKDIPDILG